MDEGRVSGLSMEVRERKPGQLLVTSDSDPVRGREAYSQSSWVRQELMAGSCCSLEREAREALGAHSSGTVNAQQREGDDSWLCYAEVLEE